MVEVKPHPHTGNSNIVQGVFALGLFATAFYFLFLNKKAKASNESEKETEGNQPSNIDWSQYENRDKFCSEVPDDCIQGYTMPKSINDLDWSNTEISVISKPTAPYMFQNKVPPKHLFMIRKVEDTIDGNEEVVGYNLRGDLFVERYEDVREHLALVKNTEFKK